MAFPTFSFLANSGGVDKASPRVLRITAEEFAPRERIVGGIVKASEEGLLISAGGRGSQEPIVDEVVKASVGGLLITAEELISGGDVKDSVGGGFSSLRGEGAHGSSSPVETSRPSKEDFSSLRYSALRRGGAHGS